MSNKQEMVNFKILIRRLKELGIDPGEGDGKRVYGDGEDRIDLIELPVQPEIFELLSKDEKEALYIWLNRYNMPQS
ncbi:hypothetical protein HOE22_02360 [Candidatus Woesearchaeota archaeon]|jgi:hypothetical protein|nr:hypothetical protein [Candidatus Woesearchaeota archaeon]MBT4731958.1 hypothetical protein [Candidatus Woesearchaeota archaeon]MBT7556452.1 hypothetical protein [Candidatus Woesearchaeota archaeon]